MISIGPPAPVSQQETPRCNDGQGTHSVQMLPPYALYRHPDAERLLPYPFLLRFLTVSPLVDGEQTLCETKTETGDGTGPTTEDSADDEDETDDPSNPGTAFVIADSNDKEDADY